jgi:hypothetical protein
MRFENVADLLKPGYLPLESGVEAYDDGFRTVAALTRMPHCRAKMVHWWFGWVGGTDQYKLWHPTDHLFSDWENREGGNYVGASHLVHEYLAGSDGPLFKLKIQDQEPGAFLGNPGFAQSDGVAVAARIGALDEPMNLGRMVHFVRDTDFGCEMRSRFFLGFIEGREGAPTPEDETVAALRRELVTEDLARRLHQHATEEMGYLGDLLPVLYRQVTGDATF